MFGFASIVFLVATSVASESHGMEVSRLSKVLEMGERAEVSMFVEAVLENSEYLDAHRDTLNWSMNYTACEDFVKNLVSFKEYMFNTCEEVLELVDSAEELQAEYKACATKSIFKQISCYNSVISKAKSLISEAKADEEVITEDGEILLQEIEVTFAKCFQ